MKIFFDGGCRPSGMEWAVVVRGRAQVARDLGPGTSMEAEWLALLAAMGVARDLGLVRPVLLGDAAAVIAQARGEARCPPAHVEHLRAFRALAVEVGAFPLRYLRRTQNLAGIALERLRQGGVVSVAGG